MPAIKFKPSPKAQKRDFWGNSTEGQQFKLLLDLKFGTYFGARRDALAKLDLGRRLCNMYITGERAIPEQLWKTLRKMKDYEDIDPLS